MYRCEGKHSIIWKPSVLHFDCRLLVYSKKLPAEVTVPADFTSCGFHKLAKLRNETFAFLKERSVPSALSNWLNVGESNQLDWIVHSDWKASESNTAGSECLLLPLTLSQTFCGIVIFQNKTVWTVFLKFKSPRDWWVFLFPNDLDYRAMFYPLAAG